MEQRIDSIIPSEHTAGTDPAYVPGVTPARPAQAGKDAPEQAGAEEVVADAGDAVPEDDTSGKAGGTEPAGPAEAVPDDDAAPEDDASEVTGSGETAADDTADGDTADDDTADDDTGDPDEAAGDGAGAADGPVFEASDHRASIKAGPAGVVLRLDQEEAEFGWDEIGAVAIDAPRLARWFRVTVHTTAGRSYEGEVEAKPKNLRKEWAAELDAVLDACFEEAG